MTGCESFTETSYLRVVGLVEQAPQKVEEYYALGTCGVWFQVRMPHGDSPLGVSVTPVQREYLVSKQDSVALKGRATRGDEVKTFELSFNANINLGNCRTASGKLEYVFEERVDVTIPVTVLGGAVFFDSADPTTAQLRFDAFAQADDVYGDKNGKITVEEAGLVPMDPLFQSGGYALPADLPSPVPVLLEYVRVALAERLVQLGDGGHCSRSSGEGDFK